MAKREVYVRGHAEVDGVECHPGLEYRDGDSVDYLSSLLQNWARRAIRSWNVPGCVNHMEIMRQVEECILEEFPGRAYFIETEEEGRGVQVYQPFGMPRGDQ
jgi:hypothetical protein